VETIEYRTHDKTGWGPGAWQDEPDKVQWADPATGLPCLIKRNGAGSLCGYVGVPDGHPWFGTDGDDLDGGGPHVHGGITYTGLCQPGPEAASICHVPAAGESDRVWWLGFDAAHSGDFCPAYEARVREVIAGPGGSETYRDRAYIEAQCAHLAHQVKEAAGVAA
jgi:hypothetical protein